MLFDRVIANPPFSLDDWGTLDDRNLVNAGGASDLITQLKSDHVLSDTYPAAILHDRNRKIAIVNDLTKH